MIALGLPNGGIIVNEKDIVKSEPMSWRGFPCIAFLVDGLPITFMKKYETEAERNEAMERIRQAREKQEADRILEERKKQTDMELEKMRAQKEARRERDRKRAAERRKAEAEKPKADVKPITLKDGTKWKPTQEDFDDWVEMFPDIDVAEEFSEMRRFCLDKANKRKTAAGIKRFVTNWLKKAREIKEESPQKKPSWAGDMMRQDYDMDQIEKDLLSEETEQ